MNNKYIYASYDIKENQVLIDALGVNGSSTCHHQVSHFLFQFLTSNLYYFRLINTHITRTRRSANGRFYLGFFKLNKFTSISKNLLVRVLSTILMDETL